MVPAGRVIGDGFEEAFGRREGPGDQPRTSEIYGDSSDLGMDRASRSIGPEFHGRIPEWALASLKVSDPTHHRPPALPPLDFVRFDSAEADVEGFEIWHELTRPFFDIANLNKEAGYESRFEFCDIDGLCFNKVSYGATRYARNTKHVGPGETDLLVLHLLLRGTEKIEVNGQCHLMAADRIVLHDWSSPYASTTTDCEQISVSIPRHLVSKSDLLHGGEHALTWRLDEPAGRLLATALTQIWTSLPTLSRADASPISAGFLGLLNGFIDCRLDRVDYEPGLTPITASAMKSYIHRHLANPELGIEDLMSAFHASPSTIYRLFRDCGGVKTYIRNQRLIACRNELLHLHGKEATAKSIAERHGFLDTGYFHRIFKKEFGMTPGEAIECGSGPGTAQAQPSLPEQLDLRISKVHQWLRNDFAI